MDTIRWYKLDEDHNPVPCSTRDAEDLLENIEARCVRSHLLADGKIHVSTVFLVLDHNYGQGPPVLFETMIFGGGLNGYQERCCTWDEAIAMHTRALDKVWAEELAPK